MEDAKAFYHAAEEYNSIEQALELLNKVENSQIAARSASASGALLHPTSMDFVNGSCIPTTAYVMLNYRGLIPSGENYIRVMDNYIIYGNLTYMRTGMNQYLQDSGQSSIAWVNSSSYSLALIQTHINNDRPISLGLNANDQLNTGGGHAVTVTGYYWNYSSGYVMLTVNNSWGYSSTLTYYSYNTPSWLVDHIYFQY